MSITEATFTFRVDDALKTAFAEAARANDLTAAQVLRAAMRDYVARNARGAGDAEWLAGKVARAFASLAAGQGREHEVVSARFAAIRTEARLGR